MDHTYTSSFNLTDEQKKELLLSYEESFDEENLLDHEIVKQQYANG
jgi:hypothetical protein